MRRHFSGVAKRLGGAFSPSSPSRARRSISVDYNYLESGDAESKQRELDETRARAAHNLALYNEEARIQRLLRRDRPKLRAISLSPSLARGTTFARKTAR
eukprot:gnl/Trimastix_PCT/2393.p5 GENE.gnl/Trimastix_PCT/2393~~gnl/Trimastix_PCT/2393.p5  ORF type:complete len:100 (+),score=29.45 gnl/Trimastix_PCT/2393:748-1047(+)